MELKGKSVPTPDPVARLCDVAVKAISEFSARSDRDAKLIKALVDALMLGADRDLQVRRIELETIGSAPLRPAPSQHLNGFASPEEDDSVTIPGRG